MKLAPTNQSMSLDDITEHSKIIENLKIPMILVGNKTDLEEQREVTKERANALAQKFKCEYVETSAKSGSNVEVVFKSVTKLVLEKRGLLKDDPIKKRKKSKCIIL
jgi:GTPase SAR1 family protein